MHLNAQLHAPHGFEGLVAGVTYHLMYSDAARNRVLLLTFNASSTAKAERSKPVISGDLKAVVVFLHRDRFEEAIKSELIRPSPCQRDLPHWLDGVTLAELIEHDRCHADMTRPHEGRIDAMLAHLWPALERVRAVFEATDPAAYLNKLARACTPAQNESRYRLAFFSYIAFGQERLALHYRMTEIGKWDRKSHERKFGRPSKFGARHGHSSCGDDVKPKCEDGFRRFATPGASMRSIYRQTMLKVFGCMPQTGPDGRMAFSHPEGARFPTIRQFTYRVNLAFDLETRRLMKYGASRFKSEFAEPRGSFIASVAYAMEALQSDAYFVEDVAKGYLEGSFLPRLCVVRFICVGTGAIVGIGFSVKGERAEAYRMAKFCMAVDKVWFCKLFGIVIREDEWPTVGLPMHDLTDRGPGATSGGDPVDAGLLSTIKEIAPSYSGQSKANVETRHPKSVKPEGAPQFKVTSQTLAQLAAREIWRVIESNKTTDVISRLGPSALSAGVLPTPIGLWNYLTSLGRTMAYRIPQEQAIRGHLKKIDVTVEDGAVYFLGFRFWSKALHSSGVLTGAYAIQGYAFPMCLRHIFLDTPGGIIVVDAAFGIQTAEGEMFLSIEELEQLAELRSRERASLTVHREAAKADVAERFEAQTGDSYENFETKPGRAKRGNAASQEESRQILPILRAQGGKP